MKQIVIVTSDRRKYEKLINPDTFFVSWCSFVVSDIIRMRDRSNLFILCPDGEHPDLLRRVGLYLRDLCLEDEKYVCIYGEKTGVDIINSLVPSLFVRASGYFHTVGFEKILEALVKPEKEQSGDKPGILIVDDDIDYIGKLRLHLDPFFNIYVSHMDLKEAGRMMYFCNIVMLNPKARYTMSEMMDFFRMALNKKRSGSLQVYYLTDDKTEQDRLNMESGQNGIAFSKQSDVARLAEYFIKRFPNGKRTFGNKTIF